MKKISDQQTAPEAPQEAALIAVLADVIERLCVEERPAAVVQSPQTPAKAA